jgi:hypothetical protein
MNPQISAVIFTARAAESESAILYLKDVLLKKGEDMQSTNAAQ